MLCNSRRLISQFFCVKFRVAPKIEKGSDSDHWNLTSYNKAAPAVHAGSAPHKDFYFMLIIIL